MKKTVAKILLFIAAQVAIIGWLLPLFFSASSDIAVGVGFIIMGVDILWVCDLTNKIINKTEVKQ